MCKCDHPVRACICAQVLDKAALQELFAAQAPFDILISAATGGERAFGPFLKMDMDGYAGSFDKLWGYANVIRFGTEYLPADGCIVLVSGTPAKRAKLGQISLASVGASVEHLVRSVAAELAPRRINCVSPGLIGTPMHTDGSPEKEKRLLDNTAGNLIPRPVSQAHHPTLVRHAYGRSVWLPHRLQSLHYAGNCGGVRTGDYVLRDQRLHDWQHDRGGRGRALGELVVCGAPAQSSS